MSEVEIAGPSEASVPREETKGALEDFGHHSRGRLSSLWAQRSLVRDLQISVLVATWTLILSLPVIVWPWAEYMNHTWCRNLDLVHCVDYQQKTPLCKISWNWGGPHCIPAQPSAFLNLWGTMLLQFIFSVYVDLGSSVKFTLQGLVGTILAYLNVMLLNNALGFLLGGGAYSHSTETDSQGVVISGWLPLCNNGVRRLADQKAHCFMNIWLDKLTWLGSLSFFIVAVDFTLFVVLCLSLPFHSNPRIFALSTHVSFMMTFVDPETDGFSTEPTYATDYLQMIGLASFMALACFFVPKRRFTGTAAATSWGKEATEVTKVLVRRLPDSLEEVLRLKARATLETAEKILKELERSVDSVKFEGFAWLWQNDETRRRLELLPGSLERCLRRLPAIYQSAEAFGGEISAELFQCLQQCCEASAAKLDILLAEPSDDTSSASVAAAAAAQAAVEAEEACREAEKRLAQMWMDKDRKAEVSAFILVVSGVLAEVNEVVAEVQRHPTVLPGEWSCRACRRLLVKTKTWWSALLFHKDDTEAVHPRFVVRNTISICLAFSIGWLGIWNVMPSYSSYAASTIAVIVYTYTGATPSVTLRCLSGVVLGKVAGSILQLALAVKHVVYIFFFALAMWLVVAFSFFQYLHTGSDLAPVFGLTAAFAAASMIPSSGVLRNISDNTQASVLPTLMNTVVQTVFGISLMLLVDTLLATRATKQARQRLGRAMDRRQLCLEACAGSHLRPEEVELVESSRSAFLQDLDALKDLLPHAAAEPIYWSKPFELELFTLLEACLRAVANHMGMLCWLVKFAGPALLPLGASWDQLHQCWHTQVTRSWSEICQICKSIVEPQSDADERLQEVLKELAQNLYTFQVASKVKLRLPRPSLPRGGTTRSGFRKLIDKVVHEDLDEDPRPADKSAEGSAERCRELDLEQCIAAARREALELERPCLPQESALCAVDVASQLMRGSLEDIRKIQLALLEF